MRKAQRKAAEADAGVKRKPAKDREAHYNKASCDMRQVAGEGALFGEGWRPGDFYFGEQVYDFGDGVKHPQLTLFARYPDGTYAGIPIRPVPADRKAQINGGHSWEWDGNREKPTLNPSVHHIGHWHGWIRAGRMVSV